MKNKYIDWTLGHKCGHYVLLWPDLDLEFSRSKIGLDISQQKIATKQKKNISFKRLTSNLAMNFDLGYDFDFEHLP